MKKLLFFVLILGTALALAAPIHADAQLVKKFTVVKDSTVNTDTTIIPVAVDLTTKSLEIHATKVSGTVAGKFMLQGLAPDAVNWVSIDSATLTDVPVNFKIFTLTTLPYSAYRFRVTGSGTNKIKPIVAWSLRRN